MKEQKIRILLVEDVLTDAELAQREIRKSLTCEFLCVDTREDFLNALSAFKPDLIISDYQMPAFDGITALRLAIEHVPETPVIILTAATNEDTAVGCMKAGAKDYVIKEHIKRLGQAVLHALGEKETAALKRQAEKEKMILEQQLTQAQKLESIGRLAGGVAHDFNNMLGVIIGYTEIMKAKLPHDSPLIKNLLEIEKAALHSRDITRQLLAFSRNQIASPRLMNLNDIIRATQKTLLHLIGEDIEIVYHLADDLWNIKFDETQAEQILMNLAVNAGDAMAGGGRLVIETENSILDEIYSREHPECTPGRYVRLTVMDNGCGMDSETLQYIYEPFFTTKAIGKGTGLGLATVYGNVKQNGGSISVDSEIGKGTVFHIFIPANESSEEIEKHVEDAQIQPAQGTILLVEDEELLRNMIGDMLEAIGYRVISSCGPGEAISKCSNNDMPIDLLLTDIIMPEMNGNELKKKIEEMRPGIKTLFISGYASDAIIQHNVLIEGTNFLQKPFNISDLAKQISNIIKGTSKN